MRTFIVRFVVVFAVVFVAVVVTVYYGPQTDAYNAADDPFDTSRITRPLQLGYIILCPCGNVLQVINGSMPPPFYHTCRDCGQGYVVVGAISRVSADYIEKWTAGKMLQMGLANIEETDNE